MRSFFYLYEGKTREIEHNIPKLKNFVDHSFIRKDRKKLSENGENKNQLLYAILTSSNELYILQGLEKSLNKTASISNINDPQRIEKFIIIQHLTDIFDNKLSVATKLKVVNQNNCKPEICVSKKACATLISN
jgi:hypothetical protein